MELNHICTAVKKGLWRN